MAGRHSLWNRAQWDWAVDQVCNHHYKMEDMVEFLGTSYKTLHARIRRKGLAIKRYYHPNDLDTRKAEFLALGEEKTKCTTKSRKRRSNVSRSSKRTVN